ncbi:MAG: hypothetical protein AAGF88_08910 [Pseudomonadota bacterium]
MIELRHADARLSIDPEMGNFPAWEILGRSILHHAPWRDEPEVQADQSLSPGLRRLAGDFFCMPFGFDDVAGDPLHGHPANGPWSVVETGHAHAVLRLEPDVRGARVTKSVRIAENALYQAHVIDGGAGEMSFAHHPMARMETGGTLSFSPKRIILTDPKAQYDGHNLWSLGQIRPDLRLACEDGSSWDLHSYPTAHAVEDFVVLVEARGRRLGWTVLMRAAEDDMLVVLKDVRDMPVTMLWVSNGGRDFAPWNSRHTGVLGIEDGCASGALGLQHAMGENPIRAAGVPTTRPLGGRIDLRHAMVSLPRPPGWQRIADISVRGGQLGLTEASGATLRVPFDDSHFKP